MPPLPLKSPADTHFALDFVQPGQLTLRMLMRSLGGWVGPVTLDLYSATPACPLLPF
jgi:hypothetical protein